MTKPFSLNDDALEHFQSFARGALVGATQALPATDWGEVFGPTPWRARDEANHTFLGVTVTRPDPDTLIFGAAYGAHSGDKEDLFVLDCRRSEMRAHYRGSYERLDPRYRGTHHGGKSYLGLPPETD